jgi:hypothetical protein
MKTLLESLKDIPASPTRTTLITCGLLEELMVLVVKRSIEGRDERCMGSHKQWELFFQNLQQKARGRAAGS